MYTSKLKLKISLINGLKTKIWSNKNNKIKLTLETKQNVRQIIKYLEKKIFKVKIEILFTGC